MGRIKIKMTQEFNLSEKEQALGTLAGASYGTKIYYPEDVKEFIKLLKEENHNFVKSYIKGDMDEQILLEGNLKKIINKLIGENLT